MRWTGSGHDTTSPGLGRSQHGGMVGQWLSRSSCMFQIRSHQVFHSDRIGLVARNKGWIASSSGPIDGRRFDCQ